MLTRAAAKGSGTSKRGEDCAQSVAAAKKNAGRRNAKTKLSPFDQLPHEILELIAYAVARGDGFRDLIAFRHVCGRFFRCVEGILRRHFRRGLKLEVIVLTIDVLKDDIPTERHYLGLPRRTADGDFVFDMDIPVKQYSRANVVLAEREVGLERSFPTEGHETILAGFHRNVFAAPLDVDSNCSQRRRISLDWERPRDRREEEQAPCDVAKRLVLRGAEGYCDLVAAFSIMEKKLGFGGNMRFAELFYLRLGVFAEHTRVFDALTRTLYAGDKAPALLVNRSAWWKVTKSNPEEDVLAAIAAIERHTGGAMLDEQVAARLASEAGAALSPEAADGAREYMRVRVQLIPTKSLRAMCDGQPASSIPAMLARQYPIDHETKVAEYRALLRRALIWTRWSVSDIDLETALAMSAHMYGDDSVYPEEFLYGLKAFEFVSADPDDCALSRASCGHWEQGAFSDNDDDDDESRGYSDESDGTGSSYDYSHMFYSGAGVLWNSDSDADDGDDVLRRREFPTAH